MFEMLHLKCFMLLGRRARWGTEDRSAVDAIPFRSVPIRFLFVLRKRSGLGRGATSGLISRTKRPNARSIVDISIEMVTFKMALV
jgi:hypothetical protein